MGLLMTGGDLVADGLVRHGVRFLFTLCGGHIAPILVSAKARGIRVVDTRHEATAVFAADAVARLTGVSGVAAVTAGPGVTNTITALKNAQMAESPLVLLGGATATLLRGRGALQDIDQMALVRPHVKRATRVTRVRDLAPALEEALRLSREGVPGPVFLECPVDLLYPEALVRDWYAARSGEASGAAGKEARTLGDRALRWYVGRHLGRLFEEGAPPTPAAPVAAPEPDEAHVRRAAVLLSRAARPVLLVGSQALQSAAEADALGAAVRTLGVPAYLSGMARGLLGPADPLQMRHRRKEALRGADLVILAGVPCDFRLDYGSHIGRRAVLVSAGRSGSALAKNRRPSLAVPGAPELFLRGLARCASGPRPEWAVWREGLRARDAARDAEIAAEAEAGAPGGLNPLRVLRALEGALADDSVVVADGGDFVSTASYVLRPRRPLSWLDPGPFGTLGVGAGFALGAKLVRPSADVWIVYGDGSVGYSLAEADTFARHGLGLVALVGNDAGWTQIAREQVEVLGDDVGTVLALTDYERAAEGLGARGLVLDDDSRVDGVLREAVATARSGRPVYVNARIGKTGFRKGSISI
ncbi:MAG TPA: thiamine pyrophosphate-binding protein [Vicinamibacteria bacterium]|nr:thiamine pyrophosphate-binding protein [Vicinamibacteria bacterium]